MRKSSYMVKLGQARVFSRYGRRQLLVCAVLLFVSWAVMLWYAASQPEVFAAVKGMTVVPVFFFAGALLTVAVGGKAAVVGVAGVLGSIGVGVQLMIDPSYAPKLRVLYTLAAVAGAVVAVAWPKVCRASARVVMAGAVGVGTITACVLAVMPSTRGANLAVQIGAFSAQGTPVIEIAGILAVGAALHDPNEKKRFFNTVVITALFSLLFLFLNELGLLLCTLFGVAAMVVLELSMREVFAFFIGGGCSLYAGWEMIQALSPYIGLFRKISAKLYTRWHYTNITSLGMLNESEKLGPAWQNVQAWKNMLLSRIFQPSPYRVSIPAGRNDFVVCSAMNIFGLWLVVVVSLLVFILFLLVAARAGHCAGLQATVGVGAMAAVVAAAALNIGSACGYLPAVGIGLPFVSSGGAALISSVVLLTLTVAGTVRSRQKEP